MVGDGICWCAKWPLGSLMRLPVLGDWIWRFHDHNNYWDRGTW